MSRIGKLPVPVAQGVKVEIANNLVKVEGPKGKLELQYKPDITIELVDGQVIVTRSSDIGKVRSLHGLYRKLVFNMVHGVSEGFRKVLIINGVGYRAEKKGNAVIFNLGFSLPIEYPIPEDVTIDIEQNKVVVSSIDKQRLGQVCSEIRSFRPPEPYKGKGIRYEDEHVRKKVGKTGVK
ncbi:MAG: 50S ribosomal protein L6 [Spirochaetales bacterium]|nr:50S ribosomal protein L6 [Spirochaetales bacterium]